MRRAAALALALGLVATAAHGQTADAPPAAVHGRLELQDAGDFARGGSIDATLGAKTRNDALADLRLTWEPTWGRWSAQVHYDVNLQYGDTIPLARAEAGLEPSPPDNWADLTGVIADHGRARATQRIDRLSLAYSTPDIVVRVGRQALSWGSGLVFRPMDLFNPFSPSAVDTEYKPGADMVYVQRLFADGSDLQLIAVPRPDHPGGAPTGQASSFAAHYQRRIGGRQTTWLLTRDHGDWVAAAGVSGALGGATWNAELVPTFLRHGGTKVSALANISTALTLGGRNATVFAEYFHNGFGVGDGRYDLADLPPSLTDRLARGQLFSTRRDYLAGGLTLEVTPLLTLSPTVIAELNGPSAFLLASATYSLGDNLTLIGGAQVPVGGHGSEFGGLPLSAANPLTLAAPARVYIQLRRYF